jgi:hypothetical protein
MSRKYADSGINYLEKSFIILTVDVNVTTLLRLFTQLLALSESKSQGNMPLAIKITQKKSFMMLTPDRQ